MAFECSGDIEILDVQDVPVSKKTFVDSVFEASKYAYTELGLLVLCIHADADSKDDSDTFQNKINPAVDKIVNAIDKDLCKLLVPLVPIVMTESWMLADKELLREEIGTNMSFSELGYKW